MLCLQGMMREYVPSLSSAPTRQLSAMELSRFMPIAREGDRREGVLLRQGKGWFHIRGVGHNPGRFNHFLSAPQLEARNDVHIPYCPELEKAVLPDLDQLLSAIYTTLE